MCLIGSDSIFAIGKNTNAEKNIHLHFQPIFIRFVLILYFDGLKMHKKDGPCSERLPWGVIFAHS